MTSLEDLLKDFSPDPNKPSPLSYFLTNPPPSQQELAERRVAQILSGLNNGTGPRTSPPIPYLPPIKIKTQPKIGSLAVSDLRTEVSQILSDRIDSALARVVPQLNNMGFGEGSDLDTAVLYIDIRKSTQIVPQFGQKQAAKIYRSFHRLMSRVGRSYGGEIVGFAGDRIMIVFPPKQGDRPRSNAVETAIAMNYALDNILNPELLKKFNYQIACGIGIDFGKMLVVRAGTPGAGNSDRIWVGDPANQASHLADDVIGIVVSEAVYSRMSNDLKESSRTWIPMTSEGTVIYKYSGQIDIP